VESYESTGKLVHHRISGKMIEKEENFGLREMWDQSKIYESREMGRTFGW